MNRKKSLITFITAIFLAPSLAFAAGIPDDVDGVVATAIDDVSIGLSWNETKDEENEDVESYRIYYGTTSVQTEGQGEYDSEIDTPTNSTSYVVSGLTAETTYYFAITAFSSDGFESDAYSWEAVTDTLAVGGQGGGGEEADTTSPTVTSVTAPDKNHVEVVFSEAVVLPESPELAFLINEQINPENMLEVMSAALDSEDATKVILETADQSVSTNYIVTAGVTITDTAENPIVSGATDSGLFIGSDVDAAAEEEVMEEPAETTEEEVEAMEEEEPATPELISEEEDTTPPENITNLILDFKEQFNQLFTVLLDWTPSINTAKDLVDQILYMSLDRGDTYDEGKTLGAEADHADVLNLEGGKEYTFKVTTKDDAGNESTGAIKAIRLPQSGLGIGFIAASSLAVAHATLRRKRRK